MGDVAGGQELFTQAGWFDIDPAIMAVHARSHLLSWYWMEIREVTRRVLRNYIRKLAEGLVAWQTTQNQMWGDGEGRMDVPPSPGAGRRAPATMEPEDIRQGAPELQNRLEDIIVPKPRGIETQAQSGAGTT